MRFIENQTTKNLNNFWKKVSITANPDKCWNWTAGRMTSGYGMFFINGRGYGAHRVSYFVATGVDPKELQVCHECDNKLCVNPNHLWLGTAEDNIRDKIAKGRQSAGKGQGHGSVTHPETVRRGEAHPNSVFTDDQIIEIRRMWDNKEANQIQIGLLFNVGSDHISRIVNRKIWNHV